MSQLYILLDKNKVKLVYFPLIIYWIILAIATSVPTQKFPELFETSDKIKHLVAYFLLAVLFSLFLHFQQKHKYLSKNYLAATILIISFYGMIDEIHQYFIPGRYFDLLDWLANFIGTILGSGITYLFIRQNLQ